LPFTGISKSVLRPPILHHVPYSRESKESSGSV
jgi:hypothetical protein